MQERNFYVEKPFSRGLIRSLLVWFSILSIVSLIFHHFITIYNWSLAIVYFVLIATTIITFTRKKWMHLIYRPNKQQYAVLISLVLIHLIIYLFTMNQSLPTQLADRSISFLQMGSYFLWAKPVEIALQQIFIIWLILSLQKRIYNHKKIMLLVALLFGVSHAILIHSMGLFWGLYFTFFGIVGSLIFTYLIQKKKNGFLYSYMIHLLFYELSVLSIWYLL